MKFPTKISCGGRSYVVHSEEQCQNAMHVLSAGRFADADRLFGAWESYQRYIAQVGVSALPPQEEEKT